MRGAGFGMQGRRVRDIEDLDAVEALAVANLEKGKEAGNFGFATH